MDVQKRDLPTNDVRALELLLDLQESKYQILIPILIRLMMSITLQKTSQDHHPPISLPDPDHYI